MKTKETKLKALFEQSMANGGPAEYRKNLEASLGLVRNEQGNHVLDDSKKELKTDEVEIGRIGHALMGPSWKHTFEQHWMAATQPRFEGQGGTVLSGDIAYVSAAIDTIAGLANARAMERPAAPEYIWDEMCSVVEIPGEGGFDTIIRDDGTPAATDLADGQPIPTTGVIASRVHRNRTLNQGVRVKINKYTILNDLTSTLFGAIDEKANRVLVERERKVADCVMGIGTAMASGESVGTPGQAMIMSQDGLEFFPYQAGIFGTNAGAALPSPQNQRLVQNFANCVNGDGIGLADYTILTRALATLSANRDPFTGLPYPVNLGGMTLLVDPSAAPQAEYLLQARSLWQIANGGFDATGGTNTVSDFNMMRSANLSVKSSMLWAARLVDVGLANVAANGTKSYGALTNAATDTYATASSARSFYTRGHFKEAIRYAQRMPYSVVQVPLSSMEYAEETVLVQDFRERGQAYWVNPRVVHRVYS